MLVFAENFDSVGLYTMGHDPANYNSTSDNDASKPSIPFFNGIYGYFIRRLFVPGPCTMDPSSFYTSYYLSQVFPNIGINNTRALAFSREGAMRNRVVLQTPTPKTLSRKIVFGIWIGPPHHSLGWHNWRIFDINGLDRRIHFDFCSPIYFDASDVFYDPAFGFCQFRVSIKMYDSTTSQVTFENFHNGSLTDGFYPAIPQSSIFYLDTFTQPFFLEIALDASDSVNKHGAAKVAVNGKLVHEVEDIYILDHDRFSSDLSLPESYLGNVRIVNDFEFASYWSRVSTLQFDSFYVCDGSSGYHDDFLGPSVITSTTPKDVGLASDWVQIEDGEQVYDSPMELVGRDYFSHEVSDLDDFLQTDMSNSNFQFTYHDSQFDKIYNGIKAIQHIAVLKRPSTTGLGAISHASPFVQPVGGVRRYEYNNSKPIPFNDYYSILVSPMSVVPELATPWTWPLFQESDFGITYNEGIFEDVSDSVVIYDNHPNWRDSDSAVVDGSVLFSNIFPFNATDYVWITTSSTMILKLPDNVFLNDLVIYHSNNSNDPDICFYATQSNYPYYNGGIYFSGVDGAYVRIDPEYWSIEDTGTVDGSSKIIWKVTISNVFNIPIQYIKLYAGWGADGSDHRYFKVQPRISLRST